MSKMSSIFQKLVVISGDIEDGNGNKIIETL